MHTPGPWTAEFDDIGNGSCQWRIAGGDENTVADSPVGPHAFDKANARLIAAAPKLLEALERFVETFGAFERRQHDSFGLDGVYLSPSAVMIDAEVAEQARDAIAEAKS